MLSMLFCLFINYVNYSFITTVKKNGFKLQVDFFPVTALFIKLSTETSINIRDKTFFSLVQT